MANGKPGRPPKAHPLGHPMSAADAERRAERSAGREPRVGTHAKSERLPYGTPQPKPDSRWQPEVQSYWKAIGMSDFALVAQPAQWMYAYVAMEVLDRMYQFGFSAGMLKEFHTMADRLGLPKYELLDAAPAPEAGDADEEEAEAAVTDIRAKFKVVRE